jgi:hypothetical protein
MNSCTQEAIEARARRAAKRVGLYTKKTRWRANSIDNHGEFQIIDAYQNLIVAGERFDMSAEEVITYCKEHSGFFKP